MCRFYVIIAKKDIHQNSGYKNEMIINFLQVSVVSDMYKSIFKIFLSLQIQEKENFVETKILKNNVQS